MVPIYYYTLDKFTVRYRGVASNYMDLANVSCNSKDSQLLAMVLLEDARLTPDTLSGAKLQLVQQAQQRVYAGADQHNLAEKQCIDFFQVKSTVLKNFMTKDQRSA
jgi:hypothetical protein